MLKKKEKNILVLITLQNERENSHYFFYARKMWDRHHARIESILKRKVLVDLLHPGTTLISTTRETTKEASRCTTRSAIEFLHNRAKKERK